MKVIVFCCFFFSYSVFSNWINQVLLLLSDLLSLQKPGDNTGRIRHVRCQLHVGHCCSHHYLLRPEDRCFHLPAVETAFFPLSKINNCKYCPWYLFFRNQCNKQQNAELLKRGASSSAGESRIALSYYLLWRCAFLG